MYKRILLKISGEALAGNSGMGIDQIKVDRVVDQIVKLHEAGIQVGIVMGGGNFWRGRQGTEMERITADQMGMLATAMNGLALQDAIEKRGLQTRLQTAIDITDIAEPFDARKALRHFEKGRILLFACGTGNPYFSTDTGAALRAIQIKADALLMAKNIDGIYDSDPKKNPKAKKFEHLTYMEMIEKQLKHMDMTAVTMCMENHVTIVTFALDGEDSILRAAKGEKIGTTVTE